MARTSLSDAFRFRPTLLTLLSNGQFRLEWQGFNKRFPAFPNVLLVWRLKVEQSPPGYFAPGVPDCDSSVIIYEERA
jgi:hypothetical protein